MNITQTHNPTGTRQLGLPFGNSVGPVSISSPGRLGPAGSNTGRDDGDRPYMGFNTQGTVAKSVPAVFDHGSGSGKSKRSTRPDHFGIGQALFVHRQKDLGERRAVFNYMVETLSSLNKLLYENKVQGHWENGVLMPMSDDENKDGRAFATGRDVMNRFSFVGIIDVVKAQGSGNIAPLRHDAEFLMINAVFGYRATKCINYWIDRPKTFLSNKVHERDFEAGSHKTNSQISPFVCGAVHEGMFLYFVVRPFIENGGTTYFFQFVPVAMTHRMLPKFHHVWPDDPRLSELIKGCPTLYVGKTSFIDDSKASSLCNVPQFTHPIRGIDIPIHMVSQLPTLTVIVNHDDD